jgi:hypothetical protein
MVVFWVPVYHFGRVLDAPFEREVEGAMAGTGQQLGYTCRWSCCDVVVDDRVHDHPLRETFRDSQDLGMNVGEPGGALPARAFLDFGFQNVVEEELPGARGADRMEANAMEGKSL